MALQLCQNSTAPLKNQRVAGRNSPFTVEDGSNLHAEWQVTPHLNINAVYVHFQAEGFLKAAGGKNTDFVGVWGAYTGFR